MAEINILNEKITVKKNETIEKAMLSAGKHPDAFLYLTKSGKPTPMTTVLDEGVIIEAIRVASGG